MMKQQRRITQAYFNYACYQYAPLIQRLAFQIGIDQAHIEELKTQALKELLKCMICYRRSGSFMTFFYGRLVGILKHMRKAEQKARQIPTMPLDLMVSIAGPIDNMDSRIMVQEYLECLTEDERDIIVKLFFDEQTIREVSNSYKVVPSTICRIKTRAINKMKQKCRMEQ